MNRKKSKKPKDKLINSILDDLKDSAEDSSVRSVVITPDGVHEKTSDKSLSSASSSEISVASEDDFLGGGQTKFNRLKKSAPPPALAREEDAPSPVSAEENPDRTVLLGSESTPEVLSSTPAPENPGAEARGAEKTIVADHRRSAPPVEPKISFGGGRGKASPFEAQFAQAEHLKMAQQRILELEKEVENLRKENEVLSSAGEISSHKIEELVSQVRLLDKQRHDLRETNESELRIFKDALSAKDSEILRLKSKIDELESRLSNDLRKVRVRERELENRLELSKAEKAALLRAKDETILELKRKSDNFESEIEAYQNRIIELGQKIESNQEQFARTVRALRLALSNLEVNDGTSPSITLAPLKKAE